MKHLKPYSQSESVLRHYNESALNQDIINDINENSAIIKEMDEAIDKIDKAGWIDIFKEEMENKIISVFSDSIYQDLEGDILFKLSTTPLAINKITGNSEGAIVGWSFESDAPVFNRLKDIPKSVITPIPGIYQASQWAYAPAGVPIAMLTGWYATQKIIKQKKK